jgi:hypothetical protein
VETQYCERVPAPARPHAELTLPIKKPGSVITTPDAGACEASPEILPCPPFPPDGGMFDPGMGAYPEDEVSARKIHALLWTAFQNVALLRRFYEHQRWHTPDVWIAAIREAKRRGVDVRGLRYIELIAADYQANGIPQNKIPTPAQSTELTSSRGGLRNPYILPKGYKPPIIPNGKAFGGKP